MLRTTSSPARVASGAFFKSTSLRALSTAPNVCIVKPRLTYSTTTDRFSTFHGGAAVARFQQGGNHNSNLCHQMIMQPVAQQSVRMLSSALPKHTKVKLPALSPTMDKGTIVQWLKRVGDEVFEGDLLCEIETDKSTMGFETPEEGFVARILIPEGHKDVKIGELIAIIVESKDDVAAFADFTEGGASAAAPPPASSSAPAPAAAAAAAKPAPAAAGAAPPTGGRVIATPYVKKLAAEQGIDLKTIRGSGPGGRIIAEDLTGAAKGGAAPAAAPRGGRVVATPFAKKLAKERGVDLSTVAGSGPGGRILASDLAKAQAQPRPQATSAPTAPAAASGGAPSPQQPAAAAQYTIPIPKPTGNSTDIELSNIRKTIAKRLTESKATIPHYYATAEINVDNVISVRAKLNALLSAQAKAEGTKPKKVSINDFIIKASALACAAVPEANSSFVGEGIRRNNNVDVSVAVSTDAGLITPIVFNANQKGLGQISSEVVELAAKARAGKLQPQEFQGGTFTVSNLGMFGSVDHFTAIINPPQAAILAIGASNPKIVIDDESVNGYRTITTAKVTLSADNRVVDPAKAAQWLEVFKNFLEQPQTMIL